MDTRDEPTNHIVVRARAPSRGGGASARLLLGVLAAALTPACSGETTAATVTTGEVTESASTVAFAEKADAAGLDFRMRFLASEQGENFKINLYDHGCGVVIGDVDGDGFEDLYFCNQLGPNALFRNRGDGTFEDVTARAGGIDLADRVCVAGVFGDYDNDGDQDLFVTSTRGGNALFRNKGDGTFEEVTEAAGVALVAHTQGATFLDYDQDGDLDLFVTNTAEWTTAERGDAGIYYAGKAELFQLVDSPGEPNVMYRNDGDGTFTDVTEELGLGGTSWGGDMASLDIDDDGDQDLVVSNMFGAGSVYRNDGGRHFVDIRDQAFGRMSWGTIGLRVFDGNNDGRLDLVFADMHSDMWMPFDYPAWMIEPGRRYDRVTGRMVESDPSTEAYEKQLAESMKIDYGSALFGNSLMIAKGGGRFEDESQSAGVETFWPWGVAAGDFDNDGREDLFFPSGMGFPYFFWQSALLMNVGGPGEARFVDRTKASGVALPPAEQHQPEPIGGRPAPRSSRCAATADLDGDGRLEIITNNFNDVPWYYVNKTPARSFVKVRLRGTASNRDGIGAVVRVSAGGREQVRLVQSAGGYLSQSSRIAHFGLGDATKIDSIRVRWPSGRTSELTDVEAGRTIDVVEPEDTRR